MRDQRLAYSGAVEVKPLAHPGGYPRRVRMLEFLNDDSLLTAQHGEVYGRLTSPHQALEKRRGLLAQSGSVQCHGGQGKQFQPERGAVSFFTACQQTTFLNGQHDAVSRTPGETEASA